MSIKPKTVACYLRVSSKDQRTDSQLAQIERWLAGNGIDTTCVKWYTDKVSGKTLKRPAFDRLQADIFSGAIGTVVVWKLDRLSRKQVDGINVLADWCERGVRIVSVTQLIDLSGAVGRMVASVLFGVAEIELEHRAERQAAGIDAARDKAKAEGRILYKGRKLGSTKAKPKQAHELRARGMQLTEIATIMGVSSRTIARYLR